MTHTTTCRCACGSGLLTEGRDAGFAATSVTVKACAKCAAEGVASYEVRKSAFGGLLPRETDLRHNTGLVTFG